MLLTYFERHAIGEKLHDHLTTSDAAVDSNTEPSQSKLEGFLPCLHTGWSSMSPTQDTLSTNTCWQQRALLPLHTVDSGDFPAEIRCMAYKDHLFIYRRFQVESFHGISCIELDHYQFATRSKRTRLWDKLHHGLTLRSM
jgi:hypothetical protein